MREEDPEQPAVLLLDKIEKFTAEACGPCQDHALALRQHEVRRG